MAWTPVHPDRDRVFEKMPSGGLELPSIWLGFALMAAAYALRRAACQEEEMSITVIEPMSTVSDTTSP
ncbi:hypothetical protein ACIHFD_02990 [Nonomuraea sp. NPDC051941]|uniref:hypothetical protein n=1 Tax=Nonomuraea sp. NPDC051941 TaxID=3364373 RepID=UPI0037CA9815